MPRRRYVYRLPCRTEYNADYNADYNTEYNAISASKLQYREYAPIDPDSDSVIPSYTTTMTIDKCKLTTTNRLPNEALPIDVPYEAISD